MKRIPTRALLAPDAADLQLRMLAGEASLDRTVASPRIQKPGLALAGFVECIHQDRVQILGSTELAYLETLSDDDVDIAVRGLCAREPAVVICTKGMDVPSRLVAECARQQTPLLSTPQVTSVFISRVETWLEDRLAPNTIMHGVLLECFGVGLLLLGKSGIGKSECALDLIQRGHRLVADDVVRITRRGLETLFGTGDARLRHHLEVRGLGILNVQSLFGVGAVRDKKRIDVVAELVEWSDDEEYDRLGLDERRFPILDVELPLLTIPIRTGRNMGAILEVAARNQVLRQMGVHTARAVQSGLERELSPGRRVQTDDID